MKALKLLVVAALMGSAHAQASCGAGAEGKINAKPKHQEKSQVIALTESSRPISMIRPQGVSAAKK